MVDKTGHLQGIKLPISDYKNQSQHWKNNVLGIQCYAEDALKLTTESTVPTLHVPMMRLDDGNSICDIWLAKEDSHLKTSQFEKINYRYDNDLIFGVIELSEAMFLANTDKTPLQQAAESAYNQIFLLLKRLSFPYLFRIRNYMANINDKSFGVERYIQFNLGRQDAFLSHKRDIEAKAPAACALGFKSVTTDDQSLSIAFLAGRVMPQSIENPRQISAYLYPQQYGPRSPTFSRASLVKLGTDNLLFISGTASIVGHETLHFGDVVAQTRETIENIKAVVAQANRQLNEAQFDLSKLYYTVYVRRIDDLDVVRDELERYVGNNLKAVYLQADVCRQDLLVEIEATAGHSIAASAENADPNTLTHNNLN